MAGGDPGGQDEEEDEDEDAGSHVLSMTLSRRGTCTMRWQKLVCAATFGSLDDTAAEGPAFHRVWQKHVDE